MTTRSSGMVAISFGQSEDLGRLGVPQQDMDKALLTICGALIRGNFTVMYSGDLREDGATFKIFRHLAGLYAGYGERPFAQYFPEHIVRSSRFSELKKALHVAGSVSRVFFMRGSDAFPVVMSEGGIKAYLAESVQLITSDHDLSQLFAGPVPSRETSLSSVRRTVSEKCVARVALGGKMGVLGSAADQFDGLFPGIIEEGILTVQSGKLLIPLTAFGGASRDVAISLGLALGAPRTYRGEQDPRYLEGLERISALRRSNASEDLANWDFIDSDSIDYVSHQIVKYLTSRLH